MKFERSWQVISAFLLLLCLAGAAAGAASPTFGPAVFLPRSADLYCANDPAVAPLRSGGYAVAWNDIRFNPDSGSGPTVPLVLTDSRGRLLGPDGPSEGRKVAGLGTDEAGNLVMVRSSGSTGLFLQRFSPTGQPSGPEVALPPTPAFQKTSAVVAPDGRFAAVWQSGDLVQGRWFTAAGAPSSPVFLIDDMPVAVNVWPIDRLATALDPAGRLVVAWARAVQLNPTILVEIVYRRFDAQGTPAGPAVTVRQPELPLGYEFDPSLAVTGDGGVTIAWERSNAPALYRRYSAADQPLGPPQPVGGTSATVASDGGDRVALLWETGHAWLQVLGPAGPLGPAVPVHPEASPDDGTIEFPVATFLADGRLAVVWHAFTPPPFEPTGCEGPGIYGRIVDLAPSFQPPQPAGPQRLLSSLAETGHAPKTAFNPDGSWVAVWEASCGTIVSRGFDATGQPRGPQTVIGTTPCSSPTSFDLSLTALSGGGFAAAWQDVNASSRMITVQHLGADGQPLGAPVPAGPPGARQPVLAARTGGGFFLAWIDGATHAVTIQPFQADGTAAGSAIVIGENAYGFLFDLEPIAGAYVAAWNSSESQIVGRRLQVNGLPAGPAFPVSAGPLRQGAPHVAADVADGFAIGWTAWAPPRNGPSLVRLRRFAPQGQPRSDVLDIDALEDFGYDDERRIVLAGLGSSRDRVLWLLLYKTQANGSRPTLVGLAVKDGEPIYPEIPVETRETLEISPTGSVASTPDGCAWMAGWAARAGSAPLQASTRLFTGGCLTEPPALHLVKGRFRAQVTWRIPSRPTGMGQPVSLQADSGAFWFFGPDNPELMVKVLDGRGVNGAFWVFYSTLTDVAFDLTIVDTETGRQKVYSKPQGRLESRADVNAFPVGATAVSAPPDLAQIADLAVADEPQTGAFSPASCPLAGDGLCLAGQYSIGVRFTDPRDTTTHTATGVPLTPSAGSFWFFNPGNLELLLKIVDGTPVNGHLWFFWGSLSNVDYDITVTDTGTGAQRVYSNRNGKLTSQADTGAF